MSPLPEAGWGRGGVGRAQGLLQLLLVYSRDVWAFNFNCVREAPLSFGLPVLIVIAVAFVFVACICLSDDRPNS